MGSNFVLWEDVYSETLRKPKKAVVMAAQSISLSSYFLDDAKRFLCRCVGVMGCRFGVEYCFPWVLLIPFISMKSLVKL